MSCKFLSGPRMKCMSVAAFVLAIGFTSFAIAAADEATVEKKPAASSLDPKLPAYEKVTTEVSGSIKSVGSDTMNNLMDHWSASFTKMYPNVQREIEGKGSATAPPALIEGTANFGPMSRDWKKKKSTNSRPSSATSRRCLPTAIDMLAVYVHKDNPIEGLTFQQIDAIFSKARKGGYASDIVTWGDLGLTGEWKDKPINLYGRNSASGTYAYFKEHALFKGDYQRLGQGAARQLGRRARRGQRQVRHRLQRHRLQDGRRASGAVGSQVGQEIRSRRSRICVSWRISFGPLSLYQRQLQALEPTRLVAGRIPQIRAQPQRPGRC